MAVNVAEMQNLVAVDFARSGSESLLESGNTAVT
jgi:hypothetical protein